MHIPLIVTPSQIVMCPLNTEVPPIIQYFPIVTEPAKVVPPATAVP